MKKLACFHPSLTEDINKPKNQLQKYIDIVSPKFNFQFKSKYSKPYIALLKEPSNFHLIHLQNIFHIRDIVRNSTVYTNDATTLKINIYLLKDMN